MNVCTNVNNNKRVRDRNAAVTLFSAEIIILFVVDKHKHTMAHD